MKPTATRAYFLHLLASALREIKPDEKPDDVNFTEICQIAVRQKLSAVVFCAVNQLKEKPTGDLFKKWQTDFLRESLITQRMIQEREELVKALNGLGIAVLLLKGSVMQELYPEASYRSMSDIDLMYFTDDDTFRSAMEKLGYVFCEQDYYHTVYSKSHYARIEAHCRLFSEDNTYAVLFENLQKRLIPARENPLLLSMTDEDVYLHLLCHAAKHYQTTGMGLRVLTDVYMMCKKKGKTLNEAYLQEKLELVGLNRFRMRMEQIAMAWFDATPIDLPETIEDEFFLGTVYGNRETKHLRDAGKMRKSEKKARWHYYLSHVFLPLRDMQCAYPILVKHPWLLPVMNTHRLIKKCLFHRDRIQKMKEMEPHLQKEAICRQSEIFDYFGLAKEKDGKPND